MGDAEGLAVGEACFCNIEHFQGGPEGFPGLRTEQNRVRDEQKEDRKKGQQDNGEQKDAPSSIRRTDCRESRCSRWICIVVQQDHVILPE